MRLGCLFKDQDDDDDDDGHAGPLNPNKTLEQIVEGKWQKPIELNESTGDKIFIQETVCT